MVKSVSHGEGAVAPARHPGESSHERVRVAETHLPQHVTFHQVSENAGGSQVGFFFKARSAPFRLATKRRTLYPGQKERRTEGQTTGKAKKKSQGVNPTP